MVDIGNSVFSRTGIHFARKRVQTEDGYQNKWQKRSDFSVFCCAAGSLTFDKIMGQRSPYA